jgi:hypothetical protein
MRRVEAVIGVAIVVCCWSLTLVGQTPGGQHTAAQTLLTSSYGRIAPFEPATGTVIREIDDPHTGDRWLLMREPSPPGGPGRLVLAGTLGALRQQAGTASSRPQPLPVIHTGDRLIVEENTAVAEARLQAVALGPALLGDPLKVRLTIGGAVVQAVALGPGRAVFAQDTEERP